jgi:hypothetical protein
MREPTLNTFKYIKFINYPIAAKLLREPMQTKYTIRDIVKRTQRKKDQ